MTQIDPERWGVLYEEAFPDVYRALVATLLDRDAARDALHDAFLIGLEKPPLEMNLKGWLYRVALRRARRVVRRVRKLVPPQRGDSSIQDALNRVETGRLLLLLTERQRSIVVAHYYLGLSQVEIAQTLGVARGTVGATISKALARMRGGDSIA